MESSLVMSSNIDNLFVQRDAVGSPVLLLLVLGKPWIQHPVKADGRPGVFQRAKHLLPLLKATSLALRTSAFPCDFDIECRSRLPEGLYRFLFVVK